MPKTLARSVIASAGMPSAAARSTASSMRTIPSVIEYSLWSRRWTKAAFGILARETQRGNFTPAPPVRTPELTGIKNSFRTAGSNETSARDRGFHDHDQRHSRARLYVVDGTRLGRNRIQVPARGRHDRLFGPAAPRGAAPRPVSARAFADGRSAQLERAFGRRVG